MLKLFAETGGYRWNVQDGWLQGNDVCAAGGWHGLTCYDETEPDERRRGHVRSIDLSDNHLVGTVPGDLYQLPYLESINFRDNGDLFLDFARVGEAEYLKEMVISNTHTSSLQGIAQARLLEVLHITNLGLTGPLPQELFSAE